MAIRTSDAEWRGDLKGGQGEIKLGSGAFTGSYSFHSRFEDGKVVPVGLRERGFEAPVYDCVFVST
jgi:hypothetical protein